MARPMGVKERLQHYLKDRPEARLESESCTPAQCRRLRHKMNHHKARMLKLKAAREAAEKQ